MPTLKNSSLMPAAWQPFTPIFNAGEMKIPIMLFKFITLHQSERVRLMFVGVCVGENLNDINAMPIPMSSSKVEIQSQSEICRLESLT